MDRVEIGGLRVARPLHAFIEDAALPGTGIKPEDFWTRLGALFQALAPRNRELLAIRDRLQERIDEWHRAHAGQNFDPAEYAEFLREIGYLLPEPDDFAIATANVDPEISRIAGPQLVVPVNNARYALNAANARWGSLYDALYGTDVIGDEGGAARGPRYNRVRGARVVAMARRVLDEAAPLAHGSHADAVEYGIAGEVLAVRGSDGSRVGLMLPEQFVGYRGAPEAPDAILLQRNGLHVEIMLDRAHPIGGTDAAGIADIVLESAITTIMDCEDSVAAVDAEDKVLVYRNWLGLMQGTLSARFEKGGRMVERRLNPGPPVHQARRIAAGAARAQPDAGAQCRPPHDDRRRARRRGQRAAGRHPRCRRHLADRAARRARHAGAAQLPGRLGLHRQAEDARAGRGRLRERAVRPGRGHARPAAQHAEDGHHGRGAAHHRQPEGGDPRRIEPRRLHQHRLPRPHRRRDPHLDRGRADDPQERHEIDGLDPRLRGQQRRYRPRLRAARPGADRQGHVGGARPHGGHAGAEDRPSRRPAPTPPGSPRPRRRPCMRCITCKSMSRRGRRSSRTGRKPISPTS